MSELIASDTATRIGVDNTPPMSACDRLLRVAEVLELIRAAIGAPIQITSGYRCEALERVLTAKDYPAWCKRHGHAVDSASWALYFKRKAHPRGEAADFKSPQFGTPEQIVRAIAARPEIMCHIDQIIMEGSWVHVSVSDSPRGEVLTATFDKHGTPTYSKGMA